MSKKTIVQYDDGSHKRYFIYRHKMINEDQIVEYYSTIHHGWSAWSPEFKNATLIGDHALTVQTAKSEKACFPERDTSFTVCIGCVEVSPDGYFSPEVI